MAKNPQIFLSFFIYGFYELRSRHTTAGKGSEAGATLGHGLNWPLQYVGLVLIWPPRSAGLMAGGRPLLQGEMYKCNLIARLVVVFYRVGNM